MYFHSCTTPKCLWIFTAVNRVTVDVSELEQKSLKDEHLLKNFFFFLSGD